MYLSVYLQRFVYERALETEQNCNILTPTLMAISVVSFSFSRAAQLETQGLTSLDAGFLYCILSPTGLQTHWGAPRPLLPGGGILYHIFSPTSLSPTHWLPVPTELYNSSIAHSIAHSLKWHVWSSSCGNNCHAFHRSLSYGASVYACTMGFYLVPYCQPSPPTRFLLITAIGMCHFLPVHHFGMACLAGSKVNIQHDYATPPIITAKMWD